MPTAMERLKSALVALEQASSPIKHVYSDDCRCEGCYAAFELRAAIEDLERLGNAISSRERNPSAPSHFTMRMAKKVLGDSGVKKAPIEVHFGEILVPGHWILMQVMEHREASESFLDNFGKD